MGTDSKPTTTKQQQHWITYVQNVYAFTKGNTADEEIMRNIEKQVDITDDMVFSFRDKLISFIYNSGVNVEKLGLPVQEQEEIIKESYTKEYKIGNRVIYETTETKVDIRGRKDITELIARNATHVYCWGCTSLTKLNLPVATYVNCWGCTSLTNLNLPVATTVNCGSCTSLTNLDLPVATYVYCGGCICPLTKLELPVATYCKLWWLYIPC